VLSAASAVVHAQGGIQDLSGTSAQEAKARYKVGKSLYEAGRFAEAAAEWMQAYEMSQKVELLYNAYVAYRDASDQPNAIIALERYLAGSPQIDADTRLNLEARLRSMKDAQARGATAPATEATPAAPPAPVAEPAPVPVAEPAPAPAPAAATASTDAPPGDSIVPYVLLGVGGALIVGGAITGIVVLGKVSELEDACPNDRCPDSASLDDRDSAETWALVTDVLLGAGVATAAVGAVLLLTADDTGERDATRTAFGCGPDGCMATVRGHF
jgi:tetratricopeptide (TPR) repeat protein